MAGTAVAGEGGGCSGWCSAVAAPGRAAAMVVLRGLGVGNRLSGQGRKHRVLGIRHWDRALRAGSPLRLVAFPPPAPQVELEQAFKLFDADQSGYVTADEIRHFMMSAGGPEALTQAECDEMIRMADPNNDGKVSLEEFRGMECWKIPEDTMTRARRSRVATPRPDPAPAAPPAAASSAAAPPAAEPPAAEPPAAEPPAAEPEAAAPEAAASSEAAAPEAAAPEAAAPPAES